jgi:16S rRNA processing protein RimM
LIVGRVLRAHGIRGEVVIAPESDNPDRFTRGAVLLDPNGASLTIRGVKPHKGMLIVAFEEVEDRTAAETLRGVWLSIDPTDRRTLGPDEFWPEDLVGLDVRDLEGRTLGQIVDVLLGAQDRLVVRSARGTVEIPFVTELVPEVEPDAGFVTVNPIPGLFS